MTGILIHLENDKATQALGRQIALLTAPGDVIALQGDLGAGKSTLARALIRQLSQEPELEVPSPTFTLVLTYDAPSMQIWHFDLYRLEDSAELIELGFDESQEGLAIIEWPERMGATLPQWRLDIMLEIAGPARIAHLYPHGPIWNERLEELR